MSIDDADFVLSIRNRLDTRSFLHNSQEFNREQFIKWFAENSPEWHIIQSDCVDVGYVRTKWMDHRKTNLQVGVDIAAGYRGKKIAYETYKLIEKRCYDKMVSKMS